MKGNMNNTSSPLTAFKRAPSLGLSQWENGNLTTNLAEKKDTNGAFFLVEAMLAPGTEPPPHVHTREDELFYVLEGEFDVYVGKEAFKVGTGEWGVLNSMRHEIPVMLKNGGGAIVNTSSGGHVGFPQVSIYIGSKHAVEGLTKAVALEFAKRNIRVNAVAPGAIATEMFDRFAEDELRDQITSITPVGRVGVSEEIAAAVLYLCSDNAKFTTGTSLVVDGAFIAQ
jgi:NAD(P)-dependent dehydrogenase (short-subunit alcohol dehydrogenase family)